MKEKVRAHVIPANDIKLHLAAMDCWCYPAIDPDVHPPFSPQGQCAVHNAGDTREKWERQGQPPPPGKVWVVVGELYFA